MLSDFFPHLLSNQLREVCIHGYRFQITSEHTIHGEDTLMAPLMGPRPVWMRFCCPGKLGRLICLLQIHITIHSQNLNEVCHFLGRLGKVSGTKSSTSGPKRLQVRVGSSSRDLV